MHWNSPKRFLDNFFLQHVPYEARYRLFKVLYYIKYVIHW